MLGFFIQVPTEVGKMDNLQQLRQPIERIINAISISLKLEVAVFDKEARLVCCTPTY